MEISIPGRYFFDYLSGIAWGGFAEKPEHTFQIFCIHCKKASSGAWQ